jgi:integrase
MLAHIKRRPKRRARKQRLTELYVEKPKPGLTWDTKASGLALRVQPGGSRSWVVVYSHHARSRWLTLGKFPAIGLADARKRALKEMSAVADGKDPAAEKKAERGAGTFADLHQRYLDGYAKRHNKSWQQADALIRRFAIPKWGKLQASAITRGDIKQMMTRIVAPVLANNTLAAVSAIFSWGIKEEIVTTNPCKLVERNPTRSRERVLADSEVAPLWKVLDDIDPVRAACLRVILTCGQRPGECAHMRREHIKDGWWELPGAPIPGVWPGTKNAASHRIWLPKPVRDVIAVMSDGSGTGFVFASPRGGPVSKLDAAMRDVCAKLGIERATPHDLRRTFGTTITRLKFGRDAMNRILNHSNGDDVGDVYDRHGYADEDKRVMETTAAQIMSLVEGRETDNVLRPSFA